MLDPGSLIATGQTSVWMSAFSWGFGAMAGGLGLCLISPTFDRIALRPRRRQGLRTIIEQAFEEVVQGGSYIRAKDGSLHCVISVEGNDLTTMTGAERVMAVNGISKWMLDMSKECPAVRIKVITRARRVMRRPRSRGDHSLAPRLALRLVDAFEARFRTGDLVVTHAVVLTLPGNRERGVELMETARSETMRALKDLRPRPVTTHDGGIEDFWADIINTGIPRPAARAIPAGTSGDDLLERLICSELRYSKKSGLIENWVGPREKRFTLMVIVPRYGKSSSQDLLQRLAAVGGEVTITQMVRVFTPGPQPGGAGRVVDERRKSNPMAYIPGSVANQFSDIKELLDPQSEVGGQTLCEYQILVACHGGSPAEAADLQEQVMELMRQVDMRGVVERSHCIQAWSSMLPTFDFMERGIPVFGQNIGEWLSLDQPPRGMSKCDWGRGEVISLPTWTGNRYSYHFHAREDIEAAGHTAIFGETRSGKTTTVQMLASGVLVNYPNVHITLLDKNRGAFVWTRAMGGIYIDVQRDVPGQVSGNLNFLQLDLEVPENEAHVRAMFRTMTGLSDPDSEGLYGMAIDLMKGHDVSDVSNRNLGKVVLHVFNEQSPAWRAIQPYVDPLQYGKVFDVRDNLGSLSRGAKLITYDMERFYKDPRLGPPMIMDIFHRHRQAARENNRPSILIADEIIALIRNEQFKMNLMERIREGGKAHESIVMLFQDANVEAIDPEFANLIRTQVQTYIIHPNPKGVNDDYAWMGLPDRLLAFACCRFPLVDYGRRPVLIFRPSSRENVIVYMDLAPIKELSLLLKSGKVFWQLLLELQAKNPKGVDPGIIFDQYLEMARGLRDQEEVA